MITVQQRSTKKQLRKNKEWTFDRYRDLVRAVGAIYQ
jgi:hypothetical protein